MTDLSDLPFDYPDIAKPNEAAVPRKCRRHQWGHELNPFLDELVTICLRCGVKRDDAASRRGRNNRKRGGRAELDVAGVVGGDKMGPLGLPWDVEVPGYMRLQVKKLAAWPSLNLVVSWIDAIPASAAMRGAALIQAAGQGRRGRRLLVLDLDEYRDHHGDVLRDRDDEIQPLDPRLEEPA